MKSLRRLIVFVVAYALLGCKSVEVNVDYDASVDFGDLHSFAWIPEASDGPVDPRAGDPLVSARISRAVEAELKALGFGLVKENADFLVGFSMGVERAVDVYSEPVYYGRYGLYSHFGDYGPYGGGFASAVYTTEYKRGILQIDVLDPTGSALIWRGTGISRVAEGLSPEESERRIRDVVARVLAFFPPQSR